MASAREYLGDTSKTQDFVLLAGIALAGYVVYNIIKGVKTVAGAAGAATEAAAQAVSTGYTATVDALSSGLYKMFGPDDAKVLGNSTYLLVNFPDGARHAVPANTVSSAGLFTWTGYPPNSQNAIVLTLVKDSSGKWYATSDTPMALAPQALQPVTIDQSALDVPDITFQGFGGPLGRWRS